MIPSAPPPEDTVDVLGVAVSTATLRELLAAAAWYVERGRDDPTQRATIAYANVHVLNQSVRHPDLRAFLNGVSLCYCDGNGVKLGAKLLGQEIPERMTGADWIWDLAYEAELRWRIYWIGGEPGVTRVAAGRLRDRHPKLQIEADHGFHDREGPQDQASIDRINAFDPDIVLVGMGTPVQERWVAERRDRIQAPVVWCLGATADFVSGKVRRGSGWTVEHAEWLSRLAAEPSRLAGRYLVGNTEFLARVMRQRRRG